MKLTLITPTLNAATYLPEALASVRAQRWLDLEHIVVDGGSTDATLDILRAEPNLVIVSEPDGGLYDAINKGIAMATGELVGFLNADDLLAAGALAAVARGFDATPGVEMVAGGAEVFELTTSGTATTVRVNDRAAKLLREQDVVHGAPIFNARFFAPSLLRRVGPMDTRFRWSADAEWLMRVVELDPRRVVVDPVVYRSRAHAGSLTFRGGIEIALTEERRELTLTRLRETARDRSLHARYRRWHSWTAAYLTWRYARAGRARDAARELVRGLRTDPLLPVIVPMQIAQHLRMRAQHR